MFQNVAVAALFICGLGVCLMAQNLNPVNAPPNCDCDAAEAIMADKQQQMSAFFMRLQSSGMVSGMTPPDKTICANDGQTYMSHCKLENAKASSQYLGWRPCSSNQVQQWKQTITAMQGMMDSNAPTGMPKEPGMFDTPGLCCLTTGTAVNDTMANVAQYLLNNPSVGVRCMGNCPCALSCPDSSDKMNML